MGYPASCMVLLTAMSRSLQSVRWQSVEIAGHLTGDLFPVWTQLMTRQQLDKALKRGQPGSLERLAYWLDLDISGPSDAHAHAALVEHLRVTDGMPLTHEEFEVLMARSR